MGVHRSEDLDAVFSQEKRHFDAPLLVLPTQRIVILSPLKLSS